MYIIRRRYKSFPSTSFKGTSLVVPDDAYHFFGDLFDLGKQQQGIGIALRELGGAVFGV